MRESNTRASVLFPNPLSMFNKPHNVWYNWLNEDNFEGFKNGSFLKILFGE